MAKKQLHLGDVVDFGCSSVGGCEWTAASGIAAAPTRRQLEARSSSWRGGWNAARTGAIVAIDLSNRPATDEDLKLLAAAPELQRLKLWGPGITDAGLDHLASLDKLTDLGLDNTMVSDAGLAEARGAGEPQGARVPAIDRSDERRDGGAGEAAEAHASDAALHADHRSGAGPFEGRRSCGCWTCAARRSATRGWRSCADMTSLVALKLRSASVTDEGLAHLKNLKQLRGIAAEDAILTDDGVAVLGGLTKLDDVDLMRVPISDDGVRHLAPLVKMRQLILRGTYVGDDGLAHLAGMKDLRKLDLSETGVGDDGVAHLAGLKELTSLNLWNTMVGDDGVKHIAEVAEARVAESRHVADQRRRPGGDRQDAESHDAEPQ